MYFAEITDQNELINERIHIGEISSSIISKKHHYNLAIPDQNYFYNIQVYQVSSSGGQRVIEIEIYIEAPGRGVEIMNEIEEVAQNISKLNQSKVRICADCSTSRGSTQLFGEKLGYLQEGPRLFVKEISF